MNPSELYCDIYDALLTIFEAWQASAVSVSTAAWILKARPDFMVRHDYDMIGVAGIMYDIHQAVKCFPHMFIMSGDDRLIFLNRPYPLNASRPSAPGPIYEIVTNFQQK